ncbi:hypothetical protein CRUP_021354 [Coryphaenoides rupestris]|nr:hypothetical protein CRUP_021354 [Coryphaenoides rupestris]
MELDDVVLYQDDDDSSGASDVLLSERVSGLAGSIYREFERLIGRYDEDVVKELMPLVVAVLENLDAVFAVNQEHDVELELLKEDNEQLVTQYEREKALRKHVEERYIALEDSQDGEKKELQYRLVLLESSTLSRLEEREAELKKEYNSLHQRHTEMIHSYMEHLERSKHQHAAATTPTEPSDTGSTSRIRDGVTSDLPRDGLDASEPWRFNNLSHPRSNTSLKDELTHGHRGPKPGTPSSLGNGSLAHGSRPINARFPPDGSSSSKTDSQTACSVRRDIFQSPGVPGTRSHHQDMAAASGLGIAHAQVHHAPVSALATPLSAAATTGTMEVAMETTGAPSEDFRSNLDGHREKSDGSKKMEGEDGLEEWQQGGAGQGGPGQGGLGQPGLGPGGSSHGGPGQGGPGQGAPGQGGPGGPESADPALADGEDKLEKSEVQAIIESTPELDMDLGGFIDTSTPTKGGVENLAFDRNTESLFEELSSAGNDLIGDVDDGADLLGMGREVEHLIQENAQLLETKNALNVVKNDLIAQVDELSCVREGLQSELDAATQSKARLEDKNKEMEEELKNDVPTAQRKRFTRVEMARVLMERNQYKERLMELQEAVRWAEMISVFYSNAPGPETPRRRTGGSQSSLDKLDQEIEDQQHELRQQDELSSLVWICTGAQASTKAVVIDANQPGNILDNFLVCDSHVLCIASVPGPVEEDGSASAANASTNGAGESGGEGVLGGITEQDLMREEAHKMSSVLPTMLRAELEEAKQKTKSDNGEDQSDVPTAQRKRFTRVEMARVLMERNQYKERLMELQEAVRWAEMISFSRLFSSSGGAGKRPVGEAPVNLKYNAPTAQVQPSVKKKSSTLQQLPSDKSKAFDFLNEEAAADSVVSRREQKRAQYEQVSNGGQSDNKVKNLPIPVFLRPLDEKDASMKLWCAAGVNLSGGKTRDGGSIVGASVFYSNAPGPETPRRRTGGSQSSLDKLDQEIEDQQHELRQQDELSSLVWICTGAQASTKAVVIDANQPGNILDNFLVCDSHVLCIASVPDARPAEQAVEASEASTGPSDRRKGPRGAYTEHIFTDPLGAQKKDPPAGYSQSVYVHSSVAQWRKCLHSIKLKDSVLGIVHVKGRVLVGLSDGTLAIFHRGWDLTNYHLLDLGRPHNSIRCMAVVHDRVWCGYRNKICVVQPKAMRIEKSFDAHPRNESQVRQLAWDGDGIWVSIRLDSTLRLFHAHTHQHLQDVDIEPYAMAAVASARPQSPAGGAEVRVYGDDASDKGGADSSSQDPSQSMLVMSGGEGYIDFRMEEEPKMTLQPFQAKAESSHLIVWQVLPNNA